MRSGPSGLWYAVGVVLIVGSIIAAIVLLVSGVFGLTDRVERLQRISVPGTEVVSFDSAGGRTIYYEAPGANDDGFSLPAVTVRIEGVEGGEVVALRGYNGTATYSANGREGRALSTFSIEEPGSYEVEVSGEPGGTIALGESVFGDTGRRVLPAVLILFAGVIGGITTLVLTATRRSAARAASRPPPPWGPPGYPPQSASWPLPPPPPGGLPPPPPPR
jgi:hypothetical protein